MEAVDMNERRLTVITTEPGGSDGETEKDAFLSAAGALIEDLIEQMAWKDAPPTNDTEQGMGFSGKDMSSPNCLRRQTLHSKALLPSPHILSPTRGRALSSPRTVPGTSSFETSESSPDLANFFHEYLRESPGGVSIFPEGHPMNLYNKVLEEQMAFPDRLGHLSLTSMCQWTLDVLGVDRKNPSSNKIPAHIETSIVPTPRMMKQTPSTPTRARGMWRKKKRPPVAIPEASPTVRLQMFGSEYARHLSTSALAPSADDSKPRRGLRRKAWKNNSFSTNTENPLYLDDANPAYHTGALLDIVITYGEQNPPPGFFRLGSAAHPFKLERGKRNLYVDVKKEPNWDKAAQRPCITSVTLVFPDRYEFVPPGFSVVRDGKSTRMDSGDKADTVIKEHVGMPADVGVSERAFLCFRRSREGNPITALVPLSPAAAENVPTGFTVVEKTPRNFVASLLEKPGQTVFFAYQQRLANLETLRPLPLLMSVLLTKASSASQGNEIDGGAGNTLEAYFATGGTIVPSAVGRFHIMDRTTHSLLSPSSIANRLSLIEQSRISAGKKSSSISESTELMTSLSASLSRTASNGEIGGRRLMQDGVSEVDDSQADLSVQGDETLSAFSAIFRQKASLRDDLPNQYFFLKHEEMDACSSALSFIPTIETSLEAGAVNVHHTRCLLITPILTSCYNRHGGSALIAVEGLFHLLTKTEFFQDDVELSDDGDDDSCSRLTLLDLTIQVVCDVATLGAQETTFGACVEFVETAVRYAQGHLNTRTVGYIIRFYLFIFYFGASVPTAQARWPNPSWGSPPVPEDCTSGDNTSILYDPRKGDNGSTYLPGGAPQSAALALKELISFSLVRLGKVSVSNIIFSITNDPSNISDAPRLGEDVGSFIGKILSSRVDDAVAHVERANYSQLALHQIHRSGGSELFWHDMVTSCGLGLFGRDPKLAESGKAIYIMIFAMMSNLSKVAFGKIRMSSISQDTLPRDIASKMLSLELLLHFLEYWSDEQEAVSLITVSDSAHSRTHSTDTLCFLVRRMIAPCLLSNTKIGLEDSAVFSRIVRIVFELWKSPIYRRHCKAELGVLIEHFVIRLLQLGPQLLISEKRGDMWSDQAPRSFHFQQLSLLREIKRFFVVEPQQAVELFINYDTDFESHETGAEQLLPGSQWKLFQRLSSALCGIAEQCGEVIGRQIEEHRAIIDSRDEAASSPKVHIDGPASSNDKAAIRESARVLRTASLEALSQIVRAVALSAGTSNGPKYSSLFFSWSSIDHPAAQEQALQQAALREDQSINAEPSKREPNTRLSKEKAVETAVEISRKKTLKKAVEYLIACNVIPPSPRDIATFLRIHKKRFDPSALGLYLGESGVGGTESEYWNSIRLYFVRPIPFVGMNVDQGLRHFLTHCGFLLPGEAQKIDRIVNTFAQCYYEDNAGDLQLCPFKNEDTVYLLCFAIIMLNTDLHKNYQTSRRGKKKMSKTDFISNLRGVEQGDDIPRQYLSDLYDSVEANPIVLDQDSSESAESEDKHALVQAMLNNVRTVDSLLHSLAVHDFRFVTVDDIAEVREVPHDVALASVTKESVSKTWHHWHSVISTCLETAHLDLQGMEPCVDILLYSLAITVCLGMSMESAAFLTQLGRLKSFEELRQGRWIHAPDNEAFRGEDWYLELEEACNGSEDRRVWALRNIREWMESVQGALLEDVCSKADLTRAIAQLENGDALLQDPARSFVRAGDLMKKSGRTGRAVEYRFFLFSDLLVYAKPEGSGKYRTHEELPLYQMKIVDWYPSTQKSKQLSFDIHHPRKKFQVVCVDTTERKGWVDDIRAAITVEVERKMKLEAARLAVLSNAF